MNDQQIANCYQPLFDYMSKEHGVTLLNEETDEVIRLSQRVKRNIDTLNAPKYPLALRDLPDTDPSFLFELGIE